MRTVLLIGLGLMVGWTAHATDTSAAQAASSQTEPASATEPAEPDEKKKARAFKAPPGYKTKTAGATTLYCKKTTVLGTRFPKEVCMTETQLKQHLAANEAMGRDKDQASRICNNAGACGGT